MSVSGPVRFKKRKPDCSSNDCRPEPKYRRYSIKICTQVQHLDSSVVRAESLDNAPLHATHFHHQYNRDRVHTATHEDEERNTMSQTSVRTMTSPTESAIRKRARSRGYRLRKDAFGDFTIVQADTGRVLQAVQDPGVMFEYSPGAWMDPGSGEPYLLWDAAPTGPHAGGLRLSLEEIAQFLETGTTRYGGFRPGSTSR